MKNWSGYQAEIRITYIPKTSLTAAPSCSVATEELSGRTKEWGKWKHTIQEVEGYNEPSIDLNNECIE
jgi:hypothetical protein